MKIDKTSRKIYNDFMEENLELDLNNSDYIIEKCLNSENYSQNLYASLCNRKFLKNEKEWCCSWRHAGGIVAGLRRKKFLEEYVDWYCSGMFSDKFENYINEGEITEEISNDLLKLGWTYQNEKTG